MELKLKRSSKRFLALLALLPLSVMILAAIYMVGMAQLEGTPRTYLESLQWAAETITTTGYGGDNHWSHPAMALFVILGQFLGQFMVFLVFPVVVLPYFEEQFEARLPHVLPPMNGKVLFCRYAPAIEWVLDEFIATKTPFVILEENLEIAHSLRDRGYEVVFTKLADDPGSIARVKDAKAVVASGGDHANAACTIIVREQGFEGPVYALADDPLYRAPMIHLGATEVFTPSHVLGAALASHASTRISPPAEGMDLLGSTVGMAEFRVRAGSALAGKTFREVRLRQRHGVTVIGQWLGGEFVPAGGPDTALEAGAILVAVGAHANLEAAERMAMPIRRDGPIVLAGYGSVGHKVVEMLRDAGEQCVVIDNAAMPGVDVVGSVLESGVLERAGVRDAAAVVLALSEDAESVFATAVVREFAPEVPLIVRAQRTRNTPRLYRAGADFAISVGQVAGQILAYQLLGEQAMPLENRVKFVRVTAGALAGRHPWRTEELDRLGVRVVAVDRGHDVIVEFDDDFRVRDDDALFVCGPLTNLDRYQRAFHASIASERA